MTNCAKPHRRYNILNDSWILVSPHRAQRPWQGQQEKIVSKQSQPYDETCYLCPGNTRVSGEKNPQYTSTYAFDNDCAAMLPDDISASTAQDNLLVAEPVSGTARVLCFSPEHNVSLAEMPVDGIEAVIELWQTQLADLGKQYASVQLFENKGEVMGCSSPHPHGQVWASSFIPTEVAREDKQQRDFYEKHGQCLLLDYVQREQKEQERIVCENEDWLVVVPYWATWPFETLLLPKFSLKRLTELKPQQKQHLAVILKQILCKYDNLFNVSFPYSMGWHNAPYLTDDIEHWQCHAHFYPPLLRSASVKKFMVGFEMLAEAQRDLTPEQAAQRLRDLSDEI